MLNSSKIRLWIALLLLGGFALSIVHLFLLRYAAGDVYPPYSSLRADPLGTKAFFESLRRLPGLDVQRNLRAVERLPTLPPATHLSLGWDAAQARRMSESLIQHWEQAVAHGGRLIISFSPESEQPWHPPTPDQSESTPPSSPPEGKPADAPGPIRCV